MRNNIYKASAIIISFVILTPLFASAQSAASSSDFNSQIQSLMSQITSLELQLHLLVSSVVGTTTKPSENSDAGRPPAPGAMLGGMRCLEIARNLVIGSQGSDVSDLQDELASDGFLSASSTGFFGPMTARAVAQFQMQFGIASSTGTVGPITRDYLRGRCSGPGGPMGSSTNMMWQQGSSTMLHPPINPQNGSGDEHRNGMMASSSDGQWHGPLGPIGSSTAPQPPCSQDHGGTTDNAAAVVLSLFVPHALIPGMMHPCVGATGEMEQQ